MVFFHKSSLRTFQFILQSLLIVPDGEFYTVETNFQSLNVTEQEQIDIIQSVENVTYVRVSFIIVQVNPYVVYFF